MKKRNNANPLAAAKTRHVEGVNTDTVAANSRLKNVSVTPQKIRFCLAVVLFTCWFGFLSYLAFLSLKGAP